MPDPAVLEALKNEIYVHLRDMMRKLRDTMKEGQDLHIKQYQTLTSLNLRIVGFLLVGNTAGILTVLQYLLSMQNEPAGSVFASLSILCFAIGATTASVALMEFHR